MKTEIMAKIDKFKAYLFLLLVYFMPSDIKNANRGKDIRPINLQIKLSPNKNNPI